MSDAGVRCGNSGGMKPCVAPTTIVVLREFSDCASKHWLVSKSVKHGRSSESMRKFEGFKSPCITFWLWTYATTSTKSRRTCRIFGRVHCSEVHHSSKLHEYRGMWTYLVGCELPRLSKNLKANWITNQHKIHEKTESINQTRNGSTFVLLLESCQDWNDQGMFQLLPM